MPTSWNLKPSGKAERTVNSIRVTVAKLKGAKLPEGKAVIPLSLGDPTHFGNLPPPKHMLEALVANTLSEKHNGYSHHCGTPDARAAIAEYYSTESTTVSMDNVCVASGASGALEIVISALMGKGDNLLLPDPAFPLYETICNSVNCSVKKYSLKPEESWEADLEQLESLIDENTRGILINNPSNPCGSNYSQSHLEALVALAEKHHIAIIADEIYAHMAFEGQTFISVADIAKTAPVFVIGGLAKRYLVPGWRVGWTVFFDPASNGAAVWEGALRVASIVLGASVLEQSVIRTALLDTPDSFYKSTIATLEANATLTNAGVSKCPGLTVIPAQGAMYTMVGIDMEKFPFACDVEFAVALVEQEAVVVLPGSCFGMPNFFRLVLCAPAEKLQEAYDRLQAFCTRNIKA